MNGIQFLITLSLTVTMINLKFNNDKDLSKIGIYETHLTNYIENGENAYISDIKKIYFLDNSIGYLVEFKNNNKSLEQLVISIENEKPVVNFILNNKELSQNYNPYNEYFSFTQYKNENTQPLTTEFEGIIFTSLGVIYENDVINPAMYIPIENKHENIYTYSSTYLSENKLINVPNYINQYSGYGCSPTTAAMYFVYLQNNGYPELTDYKNLPVNYSDDLDKVNDYIRYIGDNYFYTRDYEGTYITNIYNGYNKYLEDRDFEEYRCYITKNYNEYYNSIVNVGLPVHVSLNLDGLITGGRNHDVLGIGNREVTSDKGVERFLLCNKVANNEATEFYITVDKVRQFYIIHRPV